MLFSMNDLFHDLERLDLSRTKTADVLYQSENYTAAKEEYSKVAREILGPTTEFPICSDGGIVSQKYASLSDADIVDLMGCLNGLGQCERELEDMPAALIWLEECQIVYWNLRFSRAPRLYDWGDWFPGDLQFSVQYAKARAAAAAAFLSFGNTGTAVHRRYTATLMIPQDHQRREPAISRTILHRGGTQTLTTLRHPDPMMVHRHKITQPSLQLLGSWKKLKVNKGSCAGPGRRMSFSTFIWEGRLYVAGGRKDSTGPFYRDMFSVNLRKLDGWRLEPDFPHPMSRTSAWLGWNMVVSPVHKKAYLFTGRQAVDFFDLTTNQWGVVSTKFVHAGGTDIRAGIPTAAWPYPGSNLTDSTQQIVGEQLFVFGGTHGRTNIGCNLFMVLNLRTHEWRRLTGTVMAHKDADIACPGPRKTPNSWVDNTEKKFYLLGGECDRMGAVLKGELHGGDHGYAFDDFWSWDIASEKWTRQRMVGNVPAPRSETACVFNPVLNKTILWGGYNPALPTDYAERGMSFGFTYYADTFIYDGTPTDTSDTASDPLQSQMWKQVVTQGFPTYRAQAQLVADPQTGRTYLFGGFTNNQYVPTRQDAVSRSFGDIWELRVDLPGGNFAGVDVEDEGRTAAAGPWQRCFTCGSAGQWKKCAGACGGRAFFCDVDCLRDGWRDHKNAHKCRKA